MTNQNTDPIEGFQITGYDPTTEVVTIEIHRSILANQRQLEALARKAAEIIQAGPSIYANSAGYHGFVTSPPRILFRQLRSGRGISTCSCEERGVLT